MKLRRNLFIEGIGDYSFLDDQKIQYTNNFFLMLANILQKHSTKLDFLNGRNFNYSTLLLKEKFRENKYDSIFIALELFNYQIVFNLLKKLKLKPETLKFFICDKILIQYILEKGFSRSSILFYDERESFGANYLRILNELTFNEKDIIFSYNYKYWETIEISDIHNFGIVIGSGCKRKCKFCKISNSDIKYTSPKLIVKEIEYLLNKGVKFFHIRNHNILYDKEFVRMLCALIISKLKDYDFKWSCFAIPEELIKNSQIISLLKEAKVARVELGLEHVNSEILKYYNICLDKNKFKDIIKKLCDNGISSVVIKYLIGSKLETKDTLDEILDFSKEIIRISPGIIEFKLHYYQVENNSKILSHNWASINRTYYKKSNNIKNDRILKHFNTVFRRIVYNEMTTQMRETEIKSRLDHICLADKGCYTQYFLLFYSKSSTYNLYKTKNINIYLKYSWEIADNILNYTPIIFTKLGYVGTRKVIYINKLFNKEGQSVISMNKLRLRLFDYCKHYYSIKQILELEQQECDAEHFEINRVEIFKFFLYLEKCDVLLFTKLLRN